jgi:thioredoxin 1
MYLEREQFMSNVIAATDANIASLIESGFTFVDFFAEWCSPCKTMSPIMEELAVQLEGKVSVIKVDVDQAPEASKRHNVRGIPTMILFKDGSPAYTVTGATQLNVLVEEINKHL